MFGFRELLNRLVPLAPRERRPAIRPKPNSKTRFQLPCGLYSIAKSVLQTANLLRPGTVFIDNDLDFVGSRFADFKPDDLAFKN